MNNGNALLTNTPNFLGMLFNSNVRKTQFLSAIGGTDGANALITTNPEFPLSVDYVIADPSQPSISENDAVGASNPTYFGLSQGTNVIQIFTEDVVVSNLRERAKGRLSGVNTAGEMPEESSELALQVKLHLEKMKRDMNYTALNGVQSKLGLTDSSKALKTNGILNAITTNVIDKTVKTYDDYKNAVLELIKEVYDKGMFETPTLVVNSTEKMKLSQVFVASALTEVDRDRFTAGVGVNEIVTDFGKSVFIIVDNDMPEKTILLADLSYVRPVFTTDVETGEIITIKPAGQRNGHAVNIYAEFGLDYGAEFNHGKLIYDEGEDEEETEVDFSELNGLIASVDNLTEADYTVDSWTALQTALATAEGVANNPASTQDEVDAQVTALAEAIANLVDAE